MIRPLTIASVLTLAFCAPGAAWAGFDGAYIGDMQTRTTSFEDTLVYMARDYDLGFVELRAANPMIDPWMPGEGTEVTIPTRHILPDAPHEGIVINLPEMRLYAYVERGKPPLSFPIGVGREGLDTPTGTTTIARKIVGPIWRPTPRMRIEDPTLPEVVYPGVENPMGTHAMYLGWAQYAIHGTNKPFGIGRRSSSGCIRMYPEDIIKLYGLTNAGTKVTVVNQPIKLAWIDGRLYMDAHPEIEQSIEMEENGAISNPRLSEADMRRIIRAAGQYKDKLRWPVIRTAVKERSGVPVEIARITSSDEDTTAQATTPAQDKASEEQAVEQAREELKEVKVDSAPTEPTATISSHDVPSATVNR